MKYGITESVKTINSKTKVKDIIYHIVEKKANAIKYFLEGEEFKQTVVFGAYLCGNYIAHSLTRDSEEVILVDIQPHLKDIIFDERIKFMDLNKFKLNMRNGNLDPDLIVDITGIGGLDSDFISNFDPEVLIVENPKCSYDREIFKVDDSLERLCTGKKRGILNTYRSSKISKTSGTMTLTVNTILDSCMEIRELDGVLYALPELKYYEGLIFHEKDIRKFLSEVNSPAITVSSLDDVENEVEDIIWKNTSRINSFVEKIK